MARLSESVQGLPEVDRVLARAVEILPKLESAYDHLVASEREIGTWAYGQVVSIARRMLDAYRLLAEWNGVQDRPDDEWSRIAAVGEYLKTFLLRIGTGVLANDETRRDLPELFGIWADLIRLEADLHRQNFPDGPNDSNDGHKSDDEIEAGIAEMAKILEL